MQHIRSNCAEKLPSNRAKDNFSPPESLFELKHSLFNILISPSTACWALPSGPPKLPLRCAFAVRIGTRSEHRCVAPLNRLDFRRRWTTLRLPVRSSVTGHRRGRPVALTVDELVEVTSFNARIESLQDHHHEYLQLCVKPCPINPPSVSNSPL